MAHRLPTMQEVPWTPPVLPAGEFVPPTPVGAVAPVPGVAAVVAPAPYRAPPALDPLLLESPEPFVDEEHAPTNKTRPEIVAVLTLNMSVIPFEPETSTNLVPRHVDGESSRPIRSRFCNPRALVSREVLSPALAFVTGLSIDDSQSTGPEPSV